MTSFSFSKKPTLLAALSTTLIAAATSSALALPLSGDMSGADTGTLLRRASAEQHRIYPGSESPAAEKARAERNAPNRFCEKQENRCE